MTDLAGQVPLVFALQLGLLMMPSLPTPPRILYIAREPLLAGRERAYRAVEEETARLSARLGCPHPYLAMESLTGPKEIWWFNGFDSPREQEQVGEAYKSNAQLAAMLEQQRARKASATGKVTEIVTQYRPELTGGVPWVLGQGRYLVIAVTRDRPSSDGTVFQAADGRYYVFSPARTRKLADRLAAAIPGSTVVVARPELSFPARDWVAADPRFWREHAR